MQAKQEIATKYFNKEENIRIMSILEKVRLAKLEMNEKVKLEIKERQKAKDELKKDEDNSKDIIEG